MEIVVSIFAVAVTLSCLVVLVLELHFAASEDTLSGTRRCS